MTDIDYGAVYVVGGKLKGHILYYDDDETEKTAICYIGDPLNFCGSYAIQKRFLREPLIEDLLLRYEVLSHTISIAAINKHEALSQSDLHNLWSEKTLIQDELVRRRGFGSQPQMMTKKTVFLCHSSKDKGRVRRINDDLRQLGITTWLDENNIKVGDSITGKISQGLEGSQYLVIFLSKQSIKSLWTTKEWQSFLSQQLSGKKLLILPILLEDCEIPFILRDLKYADFRASYHDGFDELRAALL